MLIGIKMKLVDSHQTFVVSWFFMFWLSIQDCVELWHLSTFIVSKVSVSHYEGCPVPLTPSLTVFLQTLGDHWQWLQC